MEAQKKYQNFPVFNFKNCSLSVFKPSKKFVYLFPLFLTALFLNKPFNIDDVLFINTGDVLPWSFIGEKTGDVFFLGNAYEDLSPYESTHPPLIPYFLKIIGQLTSNGQGHFWLYHLFFLVFPTIFLVESRKLAMQLKIPFYWAWFVFLGPPFFINATNLMTDIAMLAFWQGSFSSISLFLEKGRKKDGGLTFLYLILALLTSYQSLSLIPLLILFILVFGQRVVPALMVVVGPTVIFLFYLLLIYKLSGFFPLLSSSIDYNISSEVISGMSLEAYVRKCIAILMFLGVGLFFFTPIVWRSVEKQHLFLSIIGSSIMTFCFFTLGKKMKFFNDYSYLETIFLRTLMVIGSFWVFIMATKLMAFFSILKKNRIQAAYHISMICLFFGVLSYNIFLLPFSAARYLLPVFPAVIIIMFTCRMTTNIIQPFFPLFWAICLSLFMASVDFQQAKIDWDLSQSINKMVPDMAKLWYSDDGGISKYLKDSGSKYLTCDKTNLNENSFVLLTRGMISDEVLTTLDPVRTFKYRGLLGFSLFHKQGKAGFYNSNEGLLPFAKTSLLKSATLFKVNSFLKHPEKIQIVSLSSPHYFGIRGCTTPDNRYFQGLFLHPDAEIRLSSLNKNASKLSGKVYMPESSWNNNGDGVHLKIGFSNGDLVEWVWSRVLDPKVSIADREPVPFEVKLTKDIKYIHLKVGPGQKGDYRNDSVFWLSLELQ